MNEPLHKIQLLVPVNNLINLYVGSIHIEVYICSIKPTMYKIPEPYKFYYIKYVHLYETNSKCFWKQLSENSFQLVFYIETEMGSFGFCLMV